MMCKPCGGGCWIAQQIRNTVYERVGFTLSAGIASNKDGGQAQRILRETKWTGRDILGRCTAFVQQDPSQKVPKLWRQAGSTCAGAEVPTTQASLAQLPLPTLEERLDYDTALWVYKAARGRDVRF